MLNRTQEHYFLYISSNGLLLIDELADPAELQPISFTDSDTSDKHNWTPESSTTADFEAWISLHKTAQFHIIVDSVDEQLIDEGMPKLNRRDRNSLLRRRLSQHFRDCEFTSATIFSDRENGKNIQRVQLTALRSAATLSPWIDILMRENCQILGMTSPTLLSKHVISRLGQTKSGLLVCLNPAGLRQTLILNGRVTFTRLAALSDNNATVVVAEVLRTIQYLLMSQRVSRDMFRASEFQVWVVDNLKEDVTSFPGTLTIDQGAEARIRLVDSRSLNLNAITDHAGLSIWVDAIKRFRGRAGFKDYRNAPLSRFARLATIQRIANRLAISIAVVGGLTLLGVGPIIDQRREATATEQRSRVLYEEERRELGGVLGQYPASAAQMRSVVDASLALLTRNINPQAVLATISKAVPDDNGIRLKMISWSWGGQWSTSVEDGTAPAPSDGTETDSSQQSSSIVLTLTGTVDPSWGKAFANDRVSMLANDVRQACRCRIGQLQLPYDPAPGVGHTQDSGMIAAKGRPFRFDLQTTGQSGQSLTGLGSRLARELATELEIRRVQIQ